MLHQRSTTQKNSASFVGRPSFFKPTEIYSLLLQLTASLGKPLENSQQRNHRSKSQDHLCDKLGIRQAVEGEKAVEDIQRRKLQNDLPQDGKYQSPTSHTTGLEYTHCHKVHAQKRKAQAEAVEEFAAIVDDGLVVHEQTHQRSRKQIVSQGKKLLR